MQQPFCFRPAPRKAAAFVLARSDSDRSRSAFGEEGCQVGPKGASWLWEYSYERWKLAQLLGQLSVLLTFSLAAFPALVMPFSSSRARSASAARVRSRAASRRTSSISRDLAATSLELASISWPAARSRSSSCA